MRSLGSVFRELARTPGFVLILAVIFGLQTVDRSFSPILPLFVVQLGVPPERVTTLAGVAVFADRRLRGDRSQRGGRR